jgi:threonine synthase
MNEPHLECVACGCEYPINLINSRCQDCDEPLEVKFDLRPTFLPNATHRFILI